MGTLARSVALTVVVLAIPLPAAVAVIATYTAFALWHAGRIVRDPVALAALT